MSAAAESLVLRDARVGDRVTDILITNGRIVKMADDIRSHSDDVSLDGRWVIPGLWDEHVHFSQWALKTRRLDVSTATSARHAAQLVHDALAAAGPLAVDDDGRPLTFVANGFRDGTWPDAPNLADLDAAGGGAPIVLISSDLHSVWLNTVALELFGHAGHPTGLIRETAAFAIENLVNAVPDSVLDPMVNEAATDAAARGIVGIVDFEMAWNRESWERRMTGGFDAVRVEFGIYSEHIDRAIAEGLHTGQRLSELLTVGRHKVITDGSLGTRTAFCFDEYPGMAGQPDSRGLLVVPPDELAAHLRRSSSAGISPAVHAIGDAANTHVLDTFEALGITRGRIEHAQLVTDADIARFAALGVEASVQPEHAMDDRDIADTFWPGRTAHAFVLRSFVDAGVRLVLGSDAPVAPLDPWFAIASAVGRTRDGREPWHVEQALSAAEALRASTRTDVAVGEIADLAVVELDPFTSPPEALRAPTVAGTLVGGRWTHRTL
ncbi:putative amidohydrolase YtcJ [Okibacterium sp. HSC-33S16]|uniref:amidohydrolase n=1 Tax=Okibacterium sp. HSC-33S16 TaxID=2910965 RepID=UPI00209CC7C5|nr:amidohydrolase family protein [Okibacterium sp. HSC-33S16]MCP2031089.1 putative amidohydrolase YtcJ [Okibacterium sp. HSC-33S16]